jgi:hypothetical protein
MKKSRIISIGTILAILITTLGLSTTASFAETETNKKIIVNDGIKYMVLTTMDNNGNTIVNVKGDGENSTVTFNKKTTNLTIKSTGKTKINKELKVNELTKPEIDTPTVSAVSASSSTLIKSAFTPHWNYKYAIYKRSTGSKWWRITADGRTKDVNETSKNSGDLGGFKDAIDGCKSNWAIATGMMGTTSAAAVAGIIGGLETLGIATVIAIVVGVGASAAAAGYVFAAWLCANDADYHYRCV